MLKYLKYIGIAILLIVAGAYVSLRLMVLSPPKVESKTALGYPVERIDSATTRCHNSWLHKNEGGVYELYIEGDPFTLGVTNGKLTQKLAEEQEVAFVAFIKKLVPSESTLNYLKYFVTLFDRNLNKYIPQDILEEIYGVSLFASDKYDFIGDKYHRILNYHAAHDIGHTIQNMNLVNCTAFGVKGTCTGDSSLYVGRNLDFSAGDEFAKNKVVVFCKPDKGYRFAYISWGGMIGVLSGMNEHGLTISLNSAKSGIPLSARTPVSIVARMVLQNAKNIDEAYKIISSQETFVSESFLVSSALDNKVVVIEKSLDKTALYESETDELVLTNHFQSKQLKDTELNKETINEGCSLYRLKRTYELINETKGIDYHKVVDILRDRRGQGGKSIGIGNEMAVNQLICHHSVVFHPATRQMWVSEYPYQENSFLAYDLNVIFADTFNICKSAVDEKKLKVEPSTFYSEGGVDRIWEYRDRIERIKDATNPGVVELPKSFVDEIIAMNPDFFYGYCVAGKYYQKQKAFGKSVEYLKKALNCEFPRQVDLKMVQETMDESQKMLSEHGK